MKPNAAHLKGIALSTVVVICYVTIFSSDYAVDYFTVSVGKIYFSGNGWKKINSSYTKCFSALIFSANEIPCPLNFNRSWQK